MIKAHAKILREVLTGADWIVTQRYTSHGSLPWQFGPTDIRPGEAQEWSLRCSGCSFPSLSPDPEEMTAA